MTELQRAKLQLEHQAKVCKLLPHDKVAAASYRKQLRMVKELEATEKVDNWVRYVKGRTTK